MLNAPLHQYKIGFCENQTTQGISQSHKIAPTHVAEMGFQLEAHQRPQCGTIRLRLLKLPPTFLHGFINSDYNHEESPIREILWL